MTVKFSLVGLDSKKSAEAIVDDIEKIVGVVDVNMNMMDGELTVHLDRLNGIISKLVEHVIHKEDSSIVVKETEKILDD